MNKVGGRDEVRHDWTKLSVGCRILSTLYMGKWEMNLVGSFVEWITRDLVLSVTGRGGEGGQAVEGESMHILHIRHEKKRKGCSPRNLRCHHKSI